MNFREVQKKTAASADFIKTLLPPIPSGATAAGVVNESRTGNLSCSPDIFRSPDMFQGQRLHGSRNYGCRISLYGLKPAGQTRVSCGNENPKCNGCKTVSDTVSMRVRSLHEESFRQFLRAVSGAS